MQKKGNKYGTHRVIEPKGVLTQAANRIDNNMAEIYSNEILVDAPALNIDSASFTQISEACGGDEKKIGEMIMSIVAERGKQQNPVTGSGGMFIGIVNTIGDDLKDEIDLKPGDKIASLVSLSLTPLRIDKILAVHKDIDRVDIVGQAILFESGLYARLPDDLSEKLALAALDVAGAPAQTAKLVQVNNDVLVLGAAGKSGMLVCTEAMKRVGPLGHVVAVVLTQEDANHGHEYDISICCVNIENCEMSCILPVKDGGTCYFFSMATSFTKATLGAEGCGKDVDIMMGNGYTSGHAEIALSELRANPVLRSYCESKYM